MLARGPTTPGSGAQPMSVLWTTLPQEIEDEIFEQAISRRFTLHAEWRSHCGGSALRPLLATPSPSPWNGLFVLMQITKRNSQRALNSFKRNSVLHILEYESSTREMSHFPSSDWLDRCGEMVVEAKRYISFIEDLPDYDGYFISRDTTLRGLWSLRISRAGVVKFGPSVKWDLSLYDPKCEEFMAFQTFMARAEEGIQGPCEYNYRRCSHCVDPFCKHTSVIENIRTAQEILRNSIDAPEFTGDLEITAGNGVGGDGVDQLDQTDWVDTDLLRMKKIQEDLGRKEVLEVLWVFLPYLQPQITSVEERITEVSEQD